MDTSKGYVKMCEKAKEIQKLRPKHWHNEYAELCSGDIHDFWEYSKDIDKMVWLPRQDQLQEMVNIKTVNDFVNALIERLAFEYRNGSMEQLWLAFVMAELYKKRWNGEEWICE